MTNFVHSRKQEKKFSKKGYIAAVKYDGLLSFIIFQWFFFSIVLILKDTHKFNFLNLFDITDDN